MPGVEVTLGGPAAPSCWWNTEGNCGWHPEGTAPPGDSAGWVRFQAARVGQRQLEMKPPGSYQGLSGLGPVCPAGVPRWGVRWKDSQCVPGGGPGGRPVGQSRGGCSSCSNECSPMSSSMAVKGQLAKRADRELTNMSPELHSKGRLVEEVASRVPQGGLLIADTVWGRKHAVITQRRRTLLGFIVF